MKKGRFTNDEADYIRLNVGSITPQEMGYYLDRDKNSIRDYIRKHGIGKMSKTGKIVATTKDEQAANTTTTPLKDLKAEPFYPTLMRQLDQDELDYFAAYWISIIEEFDYDIRATEKIQLKQFIILDIFIIRINIKKKVAESRIEFLAKALGAEYKKSRELRDSALIQSYDAEKSYLILSLKESDKSHNDYLRESKAFQKQLDGERSKRREAIDSSKSNFAGFIRSLESRSVRSEIGREMEVFKMAKDKAKDKLFEFIKYADDTYDMPVLNSDSVMLEGKSEDE